MDTQQKWSSVRSARGVHVSNFGIHHAPSVANPNANFKEMNEPLRPVNF